MRKNEISIQLYTTRKFEPLNEVLEFISNSGISNVELFGLESINVGSIKDLLESNNLMCHSAHTSYESIHDYKETIHKAKLLNIKHVIVPAPPKKMMVILRILLILMSQIGCLLERNCLHMFLSLMIMA